MATFGTINVHSVAVYVPTNAHNECMYHLHCNFTGNYVVKHSSKKYSCKRTERTLPLGYFKNFANHFYSTRIISSNLGISCSVQSETKNVFY